jgi:hypothetical protein
VLSGVVAEHSAIKNAVSEKRRSCNSNCPATDRSAAGTYMPRIPVSCRRSSARVQMWPWSSQRLVDAPILDQPGAVINTGAPTPGSIAGMTSRSTRGRPLESCLGNNRGGSLGFPVHGRTPTRNSRSSRVTLSRNWLRISCVSFARPRAALLCFVVLTATGACGKLLKLRRPSSKVLGS